MVEAAYFNSVDFIPLQIFEARNINILNPIDLTRIQYNTGQ